MNLSTVYLTSIVLSVGSFLFTIFLVPISTYLDVDIVCWVAFSFMRCKEDAVFENDGDCNDNSPKMMKMMIFLPRSPLHWHYFCSLTYSWSLLLCRNGGTLHTFHGSPNINNFLLSFALSCGPAFGFRLMLRHWMWECKLIIPYLISWFRFSMSIFFHYTTDVNSLGPVSVAPSLTTIAS